MLPKKKPAPPPEDSSSAGDAPALPHPSGFDGASPPRLGSSYSARHSYVTVVDSGACAEQGTRHTMEDQHTMMEEGIPFFAVYDGHGGTACAEYLRDNLHVPILADPEVRVHPEKVLRDALVKADADFLESSELENESGCVCAVALLLEDVLVVANVGDTEAILSREGRPLVLTVKHNLKDNPSELERVKSVGGRIFHNRVGHPRFNPSVMSLAVTRAIGDAGFKLAEYTDGKPSGVIAEPHTSSTRLRPGDDFLIIGCDGLWDVMSYEQVVDFCGSRLKAGESAHSIASGLTQAALANGSTDNVTAMLVRFTQHRRDGTLCEVTHESAVSTFTRENTEEQTASTEPASNGATQDQKADES